MDITYYVGGWSLSKGYRPPTAKHLKVKLSSYEICKVQIAVTYNKNLHNLACGMIEGGTLQEVVMSTIFHFSIFDIDRVC